MIKLHGCVLEPNILNSKHFYKYFIAKNNITFNIWVTNNIFEKCYLQNNLLLWQTSRWSINWAKLHWYCIDFCYKYYHHHGCCAGSGIVQVNQLFLVLFLELSLQPQHHKSPYRKIEKQCRILKRISKSSNLIISRFAWKHHIFLWSFRICSAMNLTNKSQNFLYKD